MAFQNTGRYIFADPDLNNFGDEQASMLNELRSWAAAELRSRLSNTEYLHPDRRVVFARVCAIMKECEADAIKKIDKDWTFEEKYKFIALNYAKTGFLKIVDEEGLFDISHS